MTAADLSRSRLYGILDLGYVEMLDCAKIAEAMIAGGVDLIQLRAKELVSAQIAELAASLHRLTAARGVPLIINDHPEVARVVSAEGVQLGQDDMTIA